MNVLAESPIRLPVPLQENPRRGSRGWGRCVIVRENLEKIDGSKAEFPYLPLALILVLTGALSSSPQEALSIDSRPEPAALSGALRQHVGLIDGNSAGGKNWFLASGTEF